MKRVYLTTDGACIGNPGPGGWACVLRYLDRKKEIFGCEEKTTNNRMELRAAIEGLKMLREPCEVVMVTDSQYVKKGITEWLPICMALAPLQETYTPECSPESTPSRISPR